MRPFLSLSLALLPALSAVAADNLADPIVRVGVAGWYAKPAITIEPDGGSSVDGDSIGLDKAKFGGMVDGYLDLPVPLVPGIHAGFWQWKATPNNGGEVVAKNGYAVAMWELELIDRVGVALGAGAYVLTLDPGTGSATSRTLPSAAARGWFRLTDGLTAEVRLLGGGLSGNSAFDGAAQVSWRLIGPLVAIGGWRQVETKQKVDDDSWKIGLGGPFLGAAAVF